MKNIITFIIVILSSILAGSCTKFMVQEPTTALPPSGVFSSEGGAESAMNGLYYKYAAANLNHNYVTYLGYASKTSIWKGNQVGNDYEQCHYMTLYSKGTQNKSLFQNIFQAVTACNTFMDNLAESGLDRTFKLEMEAEARLIRACLYMNLMRLYGDVPIIDHQPTGLESTFVPRNPYQEVFKFIMDDLNFAENFMRGKAAQDAANPNGGRYYKQAATAVKVAAYVWIASMMQDTHDQFYDDTKPGRSPINHPLLNTIGLNKAEDAWQLALDTAKLLIEEPSCPYALEPDFRNLFRWDREKHPEDYRSKERIIVCQNSPTADLQTTVVTWTLWKHPYGTKSMTGSHSSAGKTRPAVWVWQKWHEVHGTKKLQTHNKEFYAANKDPRLPVTYQHTKYISWDEKNYGETTTRGNIFPAYKTITTGTGIGAYPFFAKYCSPDFNTDGGSADTYIIRMADIYLWAAEACAYLGQTDEAIKYVNEILKRARYSVDDPTYPATDPKDYTADQFKNTQELVDAIMLEHLIERHGEHQEWYELHRHGAQWLIDNVCKPMNEVINYACMTTVKESLYGIAGGEESSTDPEFVRKVMALPYPDHELTTNPAIGPNGQNDFFFR